MLEAVRLKLHAKFAPGWALIRVNFDPIQETGPKVAVGTVSRVDDRSREYGAYNYERMN